MPEAAAVASLINYMQVNVLIDPLTPEQKRQQQRLRQQLMLHRHLQFDMSLHLRCQFHHFHHRVKNLKKI